MHENLHVKDDNKLDIFVSFFFLFSFFRELKDLKQRLDTMSHELKRKDMQVKELQARLDTGDGCKYISIDNVKRKKCTKLYFLYRYRNIISILIIQVAVVHDVYLICGCVNLYSSIEHVLNSDFIL